MLLLSSLGVFDRSKPLPMGGYLEQVSLEFLHDNYGNFKKNCGEYLQKIDTGNARQSPHYPIRLIFSVCISCHTIKVF